MPHPPLNPPKFNRRVIKNTILLASLSSRDSTKATTSKSNNLTYTVVTNLIISNNSSLGQCNVPAVTKKQVGFDIVLLDSKLFPMLESDASSSVDFWKSTRKIIAASAAHYEKIGGVMPGAIEDLEELGAPLPKRAKYKLNTVEKIVTEIQSTTGMKQKLQKMFECVICRSTMKSPVINPCCSRPVGCEKCVRKWLGSQLRCPLYSQPQSNSNAITLKGMSEMLTMIRDPDEGRG